MYLSDRTCENIVFLLSDARRLQSMVSFTVNCIQCNLCKPDPSGTKYFVRFRQDPDYSDSPFREEFWYVVALIIKCAYYWMD